MVVFTADPEIHRDAETFSQLLVDFAKKNGRQLDWSDDSIQHVEHIAAVLHTSHRLHQVSARTVSQFSEMLGSYLGEVYRKNHGAEWGWVTSQDGRFPGMQNKRGYIFWPWSRALSRVTTNGAEDNLWHYYQYLLNPQAATRIE